MATGLDRFMTQQGFADEETHRRRRHFRALQVQPAVIAATVAVGIVLQSAVLFLILAAVLVWNVVWPRLNVFERFYHLVFGGGGPKLDPAPGPRRFAQGMAAMFMSVTGAALLAHWMIVAYIVEGLIAVALTALIAGKFCMGSYIYHLLRGRGDFANSTCPWSK